MSNASPIRSVVLLIALGCWGCGGDGPALPSPTPLEVPPASPPAPPAGSSPVQPSVTAVAPNAGTTGGGAWATISGSGFEPGAVVTVGGQTMRSLVQGATAITFWTLAHPGGTVDVSVTNPGGLTSRLSGGYTYAPPASFDFNGEWSAHAGNDFETDMQLTVVDNQVISVSCGSSPSVTFSLPEPLSDGRFSYAGDAGVAVSGTLLSPVTAAGTVDAAGCRTAGWWADKKGAAPLGGLR